MYKITVSNFFTSISLKNFIFASKYVFKSIHYVVLTLKTGMPSIIKHNRSHLYFFKDKNEKINKMDSNAQKFSHLTITTNYFSLSLHRQLIIFIISVISFLETVECKKFQYFCHVIFIGTHIWLDFASGPFAD